MMVYPADVIVAAQAMGRPKVAKGPFPSSILAQWRLESNNGKSVSGVNNYFGIKATKAQIDSGQATSRWTKEFVGGKYVAEQQWFADYASATEGFAAHTALLMTPHYADCQDAQTAFDYCRALKACGYATAPNYADVLISIIQSDDLEQYDTNPGVGAAVPATSGSPSGTALPKGTSNMPTWLTAILGLLPSIPADIAALQANPVVKELESLVANLFTHTATPGAAVVVEPKSTTTTGS